MDGSAYGRVSICYKISSVPSYTFVEWATYMPPNVCPLGFLPPTTVHAIALVGDHDHYVPVSIFVVEIQRLFILMICYLYMTMTCTQVWLNDGCPIPLPASCLEYAPRSKC